MSASPLAGETRPAAEAILTVENLRQWYHVGGGWLGRPKPIKAVEDVSFALPRGEILGLVGESGSGKSTLGRAVLRLTTPTAGRIVFDGEEITGWSKRALRPIRPRMQMIFQDPFSSLNPRLTVGQIIATPLVIHQRHQSTQERKERVAAALAAVGLSARYAERYPHEFSGGQRQRIGIARSIMMEPDLLVADEPVSALDVSVQAQIVNLLLDIRRKLGLAILFISHDLAVVGYACDRIAVMYLGRIIEIAPKRELFRRPRHPYTEALFSAVPDPDPTVRRTRVRLSGDVPSAMAPPSGCAFRTRCPYVLPACADAVPLLGEVGAGHLAACIRTDLELRAPGRAAAP